MSKEIDRMLPVRLSSAQLEERAKALADTVERIADCEARKKLAAEKFKEELQTWQTEQRRLADIVAREHEPRLVPCVWSQNFAAKAMELVRRDTGEVVDQRAMTPDELQQEMFS